MNLSTIEDSHLFKFTQDDISRMRKEFTILLTRLTIYSSRVDKEEKELKRDRERDTREEAQLRDAESCTPNTKLCQTYPHDGADDADPAGIELSSDKKEISKSLETCETRIKIEATRNKPSKSKTVDDHQPIKIESSPTSKSKEVKDQYTAVDKATNTGLLAITEKDFQALKVPALKKLCKEAGITKKSSSYIKKQDLIQAIMDHNK